MVEKENIIIIHPTNLSTSFSVAGKIHWPIQCRTFRKLVVGNPAPEKPMSLFPLPKLDSRGIGISCGPVTFIENTIPVRLNTPLGKEP